MTKLHLENRRMHAKIVYANPSVDMKSPNRGYVDHARFTKRSQTPGLTKRFTTLVDPHTRHAPLYVPAEEKRRLSVTNKFMRRNSNGSAHGVANFDN